MSRNKTGRWWYLAFKTLSLREILLPVVGFAISFVWIWNAAGQYLNLFKELQKPVVIQAEMSQNLSSDIRTSTVHAGGGGFDTLFRADSSDAVGRLHAVKSAFIMWKVII